MRPAVLLAVVLLSGSQAFALDLPARKPGLWEITMTLEGRKLPPQTAQHCIDAETDKQMNAMGSGMTTCSKQDVQRSGNTITVDSVCKVGAATSTSHAVVTGDFSSAYTVKVTSKREGGPPMKGSAPGGATTMNIAAKWLGACKADQKPGDMILAGGRKVNIRELQKLQGMQKTPPRK